MEEPKPITIVAQLYSVTTKKDGGGKIVLEFGADSLDQVMRLQRLNAVGDTNLGIAIVPYRDRVIP